MPGWLSRHHPGDPGFRRKIAASRCLRLIPSGLSGTGGSNIPVQPALSAHPCASPRPTGNASAIYSRTEASLKALSYSEATLSLLLSNYWGSLSPVGEGKGEGIRPHEYLKVKMPPPYHSEVLLFPHPTKYVPPRSPPIAARCVRHLRCYAKPSASSVVRARKPPQPARAFPDAERGRAPKRVHRAAAAAASAPAPRAGAGRRKAHPVVC